ncbi:hypothetical protein AAHC03_018941 [Spirometra sp. Aus1]
MLRRQTASLLSSRVFVHVYDMSWLNEYISNIGLGVFHTGVEVYSREYCYGGHQFGGSGIFEMSPKDTSALGPNYIFRTSIEVGHTDFTYDDVCMILNNMEEEFCGDRYHLLRKNCNHFSHAFVEILCGASLPKWINRLAVVSTKLPFIERSIPKEWLTPHGEEEQANNRAVVSSSAANNQRQHSSKRSSSSLESTPSSMDRQPPSRKFSFHRNGDSRKQATPAGSSSSDVSEVAPPGTSPPSKAAESWRRFSAQVQSYFQSTPHSAPASGRVRSASKVDQSTGVTATTTRASVSSSNSNSPLHPPIVRPASARSTSSSNRDLIIPVTRTNRAP